MARSNNPRGRWAEPVPEPEVHDLGDLVAVTDLLGAAIGDITAEDIRAAETRQPADGLLCVIATDADGRRVLLGVRALLSGRHDRKAWVETHPAQI